MNSVFSRWRPAVFMVTYCMLECLSRFLVAVDRRHGPEVAMETVKLAEDFLLSSDGIVVGLDLSGDPTVSSDCNNIILHLFLAAVSISLIIQVGHGKDLLSALQKAKNCGLKLALHLSEVRAHGNISISEVCFGMNAFTWFTPEFVCISGSLSERWVRAVVELASW